MAVPVVSELSELYAATDCAAMATMLAKLSVEKNLTARLDETRQALHARLSAALREFRLMNAAAIRQPNKLIFPETYKYLPIWCLGLQKCAAFRWGGRRRVGRGMGDGQRRQDLGQGAKARGVQIGVGNGRRADRGQGREVEDGICSTAGRSTGGMRGQRCATYARFCLCGSRLPPFSRIMPITIPLPLPSLPLPQGWRQGRACRRAHRRGALPHGRRRGGRDAPGLPHRLRAARPCGALGHGAAGRLRAAAALRAAVAVVPGGPGGVHAGHGPPVRAVAGQGNVAAVVHRGARGALREGRGGGELVEGRKSGTLRLPVGRRSASVTVPFCCSSSTTPLSTAQRFLPRPSSRAIVKVRALPTCAVDNPTSRMLLQCLTTSPLCFPASYCHHQCNRLLLIYNANPLCYPGFAARALRVHLLCCPRPGM